MFEKELIFHQFDFETSKLDEVLLLLLDGACCWPTTCLSSKNVANLPHDIFISTAVRRHLCITETGSLIDVLSRKSVLLWSLLYFAFARFLALSVSFGRPVFLVRSSIVADKYWFIASVVPPACRVPDGVFNGPCVCVLCIPMGA